MHEIMVVMEIIGTIAFAISGALISINYGFDLFGVIIVGCITAVGGGVLRDVLIGKFPATIFLNTGMLIVAVLTSLIVFIVAYVNSKKFIKFRDKLERINNIFDAIGLAAFSVTGAEIGFVAGYFPSPVMIIVLGMLTGVGGGIFRDMLVNIRPYVFKKHIYALASLAGCVVYYLLRRYYMSVVLASVWAMAVIITIRMLATKYCWSLPKVKFESGKEENGESK